MNLPVSGGVTATKLPMHLLEILRDAQKSHIQSVVAISRWEMERMENEVELVKRIRSQLIHSLVAFAVDNKVLDDPACIQVHQDYASDQSRYHASVYMLSPKELDDLLLRAYEAGSNRRPWEFPAPTDYYR